MRRGLFLILCFALALPAFADAPPGVTSFDVAPTTLDLKAGEAGLFYITNHSARAVTIQIEALDWKQPGGSGGPGGPDVLAPSDTLFTSPPLAHISPGARQTVRVLARPAGDRSETAYRLRVSELPDAANSGAGVHVLLQFSVPVFVGHDGKAAPDLVWDAAATPAGVVVTARNQGGQTVKLIGLSLNGAGLSSDSFTYILPGATHQFAPAAASGRLHLSGHEARSGRDLAFDLTAHS